MKVHSQKRGRNKITKHHKIPTSRGGGNEESNIKYVVADKHRAFHFLFNNMTPQEVIEHIKKEWV